MKHLFIFLMISMVACKSDHKQKQMDLNQPFPLNKGNQWVYAANIKYHQRETDSLIQEKIEWTMEVVDTIHHGKYIAAIIKGFPTDLVWYEGKAIRGEYVLLQDSNKIYLCSFDPMDSLLARLRNPNDSLTDLRNSQEILFDFPLTKAKTWGADPEMPQRKDNLYAWVVKKPDTDTSSAEIQYMTNPDHSIFKFHSNVGITGYYFEHHGTVMELNMHLIKKVLHN
jgi:hypothetical protein